MQWYMVQWVGSCAALGNRRANDGDDLYYGTHGFCMFCMYGSVVQFPGVYVPVCSLIAMGEAELYERVALYPLKHPFHICMCAEVQRLTGSRLTLSHFFARCYHGP
jgi:hypothetical protein